MTSSHLKRSCLRMLTACGCLAISSVFGADQITRLSDGAIIRGKLETLSKTQIVIRRSNDETETISPADLRDIRFDREPPPLQTARSNERSGNYEAAIEQLQEVQSEYSGNDRRVPVEIEFLIARCQARHSSVEPATTQTALTSLQSFLRNHGNSYRALEAMLLQAQLLITSDRPEATRLLKQLRTCGVDGFAMQAGVALGLALLEDHQPDQALEVFDEVIQQSKGQPVALSAWLESRIGQARCLQQQNQLPEALKALKMVIAETPEDRPATLAQAWNLMGSCHQSANSPKAALLAYLHVDLLYPEANAEHAEALYQLASLWESTGHPDRASDAQSRLQTMYPGSQQAQDASR